jgi:hypothetical protein
MRVSRDADRRMVEFPFSLNPDRAPRIGTISVGGKTFTVLQQGRP